ncbi:hypothetical protein HBB16_11680 [Pseudonocardia sp. MCCB 268]|nr:hypothetical protein [Pseudonocardia cytotoxica]
MRLLRLIDLQPPEGESLRREWSIWIQVWAESAITPPGGAVLGLPTTAGTAAWP